MNQQTLEQLVKEVLESIENQKKSSKNGTKVDASQYPLGKNRKDLLRTPTNKTLDDITLESVMDGTVTIDDVKITPEVLELQAQVAESAGRPTLARNFRRAAELPDARILEIYDALRPFRSTKSELLDIASEIESKYDAKVNAAFIREAAEVYEKRKKLRVD